MTDEDKATIADARKHLANWDEYDIGSIVDTAESLLDIIDRLTAPPSESARELAHEIGGIYRDVFERTATITEQAMSKAAAKIESSWARVREMSQWQPIDTAPKDGTAILVCRNVDADGRYLNEGIFVQRAAWWEGEGWVVYCSLVKEPHLFFTPTHWMPVPATPDILAQPKEESHE